MIGNTTSRAWGALEEGFAATRLAPGTAGSLTSPADVVIRTSYQAFLDVAEGSMPAEDFIARHVEVIEGAQNAGAFFALMGAAITHQH